jgi:plasmid maintenance system antidote protein VapI
VLDIIRHRIGCHRITVVDMARRLEISQPHLSNLLWGRRTLSDELADHAILELRITAEELHGYREYEQLRQRIKG